MWELTNSPSPVEGDGKLRQRTIFSGRAVIGTVTAGFLRTSILASDEAELQAAITALNQMRSDLPRHRGVKITRTSDQTVIAPIKKRRKAA